MKKMDIIYPRVNDYNMKEFIIFVRRTIYISLGKVNTILGRGKGGLIILCYHSVSKGDWRFSVNPEELDKQLTYLLANYKVISLGALYAFLTGKKEIKEPSVVVTFDDGYEDLIQIKDHLTKLHIKPTVFVLSDVVNADRHELHNNLSLLNKKEILSLKKAGWEIGSHSATHKNFSNLSRNEIISEVRDSKKNLEKNLGIDVKYFSYPKGKYTDSTKLAVNMADYEMAVSMDNGFVTRQNDMMAIPRIGVDKSHSFNEFKAMLTPTVVDFKKIANNLGLGKYIPLN